MPTLATNKHAFHEYEVLEKIEAGLVLTGSEVKSIRSGHISLKGAYAALTGGELWLLNAHITPYSYAGPNAKHDPTRSRKLLITKQELSRLVGKLHTQGLTLVPLSVYTSKSRLKIELGVCRGKKVYEKREILKKKSIEKELRESMKRRY